MSFLPLVVNLPYGLLYSRFVRFVSDLGSGNNFVSPPLFSSPLFFPILLASSCSPRLFLNRVSRVDKENVLGKDRSGRGFFPVTKGKVERLVAPRGLSSRGISSCQPGVVLKKSSRKKKRSPSILGAFL